MPSDRYGSADLTLQPTRGVSITVNIGTAAVLYTLHDTFDPLSLEGQKCHEATAEPGPGVSYLEVSYLEAVVLLAGRISVSDF